MKSLKHYLLLALLALCSIASNAHDFEVDGIYYNITSKSDFTCEVTYKGANPKSGGTYSGRNVIPSEVTINGYTFTVTAIGDYAFYDSNYNVSMPNTIKRIGKFAFASSRTDLDTSAPTIRIPNSVSEIDDYAFQNRYYLRNVYYDSPSCLERIGNYAFDYTQAFTTLKMPDSVIEVGNSAYNCSYNNIHGTVVWDWTLGNNVKRIGDNAFGFCSVKNLKLPETVEYIGDRAFAGCFFNSHSDIYIPQTTVYIGCRAFSGPDFTLSVSEDNDHYCTESGVLFSKEKKQLILCPGGISGFYSIPETVTEICEEAFYGSHLSSIHIPASIRIIGNDAFWYAEFTRLVIPHTIESLGSTGFPAIRDMQKLTDLVFDMKDIGFHTASNCKNLKTVTLGPHVETVYEDGSDSYEVAFYYTGITNVINASAHNLSYYKCRALNGAESKHDDCSIHDGVFVIEKDSDVERIVGYLDNDTTITLSGFKEGSVEIANTAFSNCSQLSEIIVNQIVPPLCEDGAFMGVDKFNCCLYVPAESVESYNTAKGWMDFWTINTLNNTPASIISTNSLPIRIIQSEGILTVSGLQDGDVISAYSTDGKNVATSKAIGNAALLNLSELQGKVAVLNVAGKSAKIMVK